jgi:large subunit ribosomal protein L10
VNRQQKAQQVQELRDALEGATSVILTDYRGLDVGSMVSLRRALREDSVGYKVVKNTLARLALEGTDKAFLIEHFNGPIAMAWSDDPVAPARQLSKFAEDHEALELRVGYLAGNEIDLAGIKALASLPSKDELRSKFLSVLNAPAQKFVTLTSQVQRNFLLVCKQKAELAG